MRALLSVSDRTGLIDFAKGLAALGVELVATSGTAKAIAEAGLKVKEVAEFTGAPEMLNGRVKTLHPKVHGGLLGIRGNAEHEAAMKSHGIVPIDLLVVNLYPFESTVAAKADYDTCVENIDIGGPAMIRAASKNHAGVTVVVDVADYEVVMADMKANGGATTLLGLLIERGTGVDLHSFAKTALFEPLGITASEWSKVGNVASAASGLRLTPRDLALIGQMVVAGGKWQGRTVVPADWLDTSFRPAAVVDDGRRYGYQWFVGELALPGKTGTVGAKWVGGFGLGGQRLFVFPELDFVLAVAAGNYATEDQARAPIAILREVFLAGLVD